MPNSAFALVDSTFEPFRAGELWVKPASEHWEKQAYFALRRSVFSDEQQLLVQDRTAMIFRRLPLSPWPAIAGSPIRWWARCASTSRSRACGLVGVYAWRRRIVATA